MKIKINPNVEIVSNIRKALKDNNGYCPCKIVKNKDTICICKEFRDGPPGLCHCGLYIKEEE